MRQQIKQLLQFIFLLFAGLPLFVLNKTIISFDTMSEFLSLFPGYFGYLLRQAFYKLSINSGRNLDIRFGTIIQYSSVRIHNDVYIGQNCNVGKATIKSNSKIGSNVHIVNKETHNIDKYNNILPTNVQTLRRVIIGKNCWIGNCAIIMADVRDNSIIGAGSVVTKPIPPNSVAVGNPARVIKNTIDNK